MRRIVLGIAIASLTGCAASPVDTPIGNVDLADGKVLAALQAALPLDDRAAFGTYALLHWPKSKYYCGKPIGGRRAVARTVGEAIEQTRAYEAEFAAAQALTAKNAIAAPNGEEQQLINRMERLVLERDMLFATLGPGADTSPKAREIRDQLATMRGQLAAIRSAPTS